MEGREISDYHLEVLEAPFVQSTLCSLSFFHVFAQTIFKKGQKSVQCERLTLCARPHLHKGFNNNN